jgi:Na+/proline symporter
MSPTTTVLLLLGYFGFLLLISRVTRDKRASSFYDGGKKSPWFLVAFGMIGASLSGVTFISVPGWVNDTGFGYMQTVLGYMVGYLVIAQVLLPLYYRLRLTSIYTYLQERYGEWSYKTGAGYFLLSRVIGASFRLYLVAEVLHVAAFSPLGLSYAGTVAITILLIYTYTFTGGIKTIVYTDVLQTIFMLAAVVLTVIFLLNGLGWDASTAVNELSDSRLTQVFHWDWKSNNYFWKQFLGGAFIAMVMTGLDQDMMQKNLSIARVGSAQKNIYAQMVLFILFNMVFLTLGALLFTYAGERGITVATGDHIFQEIALGEGSALVGVVFILGLIAAAYSSADSALTALTTSFCVDFLGFERSKPTRVSTRRWVHFAFSALLFATIMFFHEVNDDSVINNLFKAAGFTYGPLLGLFAFGILTKRKVKDQWVLVVTLMSIGCTALYYFGSPYWIANYKPGFEVLILNGLFTFAGLFLIRNKYDS